MIRGEEFRDALSKPDEGFNGALDTALRRVAAGEGRAARHGLRYGLAIAAAALALTGAALAVAARLNLFQTFGDFDHRLTWISGESGMTEEAALRLRTPELGETTLAVNSAYFDGESVIVAYSLENYEACEDYAPSAEALAGMERLTEGEPLDLPRDPTSDEAAHRQEALFAARDRGEACGFAEHIVRLQQFELEDGAAIEPNRGESLHTKDGASYFLDETTEPLPDSARDADELSLALRLWLETGYFYTEGGEIYHAVSVRELEALKVTVKRSEASAASYVGTGEYRGVPVEAAARVSLVAASLELTAREDAFVDPPEGWLLVALADGETGELFPSASGIVWEKSIQYEWNGIGRVPDKLAVYLVPVTDGVPEALHEIEDMEPIVVALKEN